MSDEPLKGAFAAEFISTSLAMFMALSTTRTPSWTKSRIADTISHDDEIPWRVSDAMIGRLLDPCYPQELSEDTLNAVSAFLLTKRTINRHRDWPARAHDTIMLSASAELGC